MIVQRTCDFVHVLLLKQIEQIKIKLHLTGTEIFQKIICYHFRCAVITIKIIVSEKK